MNNSQWGRKVGKHAQDWGLNASQPADRAWLRDRVEDITGNYDEVRQGLWHPGGGKASIISSTGRTLMSLSLRRVENLQRYCAMALQMLGSRAQQF